jgi:Rod binding domain-containing protein
MTSPIDISLIPADVRAAGPKAQKLYASALSFEKMLTTQLTQSLASALKGGDADSGDDSGDDATSTDSSTGQLASQLPGQLATAVQQGGGLGLAPVLYRAMAAQGAAK